MEAKTPKKYKSPGKKFTQPSLTKQGLRDECNIDTIIAKYHRTKVLPERNNPGFYGDFTQVTDFQSALEQVREAKDGFSTLPSKIRKRFNNRPADLLHFLSDAANRAEALELGILVPEEQIKAAEAAAEASPVETGDAGTVTPT